MTRRARRAFNQEMLALAYTIAMLVTLAGVIRFGGAPERLALANMFVGSLLSIPASHLGWESPQFAMVAIDVGVTLGFLCIALLSERFWPLWATAFQAATAIMSLAKALEPRISSHIYSTVEFLWAYPVLGAINAHAIHQIRKTWHAHRPKPPGRSKA